MSRYRLIGIILILTGILISTVGFILASRYNPRAGLITNIQRMDVIIRPAVTGDIFDVLADKLKIDKKDLTFTKVLERISDPQERESFRQDVEAESLKTGKSKDEIASGKVPDQERFQYNIKSEISIQYRYILSIAIFLVIVGIFMLTIKNLKPLP
jgi:hypothetical protein